MVKIAHAVQKIKNTQNYGISEATILDAADIVKHKYRLDGSSFSMPDTKSLQKAFGQPGGQKKGCGFPVAHLLLMTDAVTGLILDVVAGPLRTHEMSQVTEIHPKLRPGDVLVGDRGFCSFAHLALLLQDKLHAVLRIHQRTIVDFAPGRPYVRGQATASEKGLPRSKWLQCIGTTDQIVRWFKPRQRPRWMSCEQYKQLPESITVRELKYRVETPGYRTRCITLVTTLVDGEKYPAKELAELYRCRWQIEINLRHLKQTMGMDVLHCQTADGVRKEMMMFAIVYNLVCCVIYDAADRQGVQPDRISFIDALRWLRTSSPGRELIELIINPHRPGRFEPRVVKRRPKQYSLMTKRRKTLRNRLRNKHVAA